MGHRRGGRGPTPAILRLCEDSARERDRRPLASRALADRFDQRRGSTYDLPSGVDQLNPTLDSCQHLYNHRRPHGAPAGITPSPVSGAPISKDTRAVPYLLNPTSS